MYFSTSFSFSDVTSGTTTIFIRPGNGTSSSPLIFSRSSVDFRFAVMAQLPPTHPLP